MNIQGTYTNKGLALTAKTAVGACLRVTRVVGGSGHTPDIPNAAALPEIRQTLAVGEARCAGSTAVLPVTLAAVGLESSYTLTELGVYAEDPNEGEILYCIYRLDEPTTIWAGSDTVLRFNLRQTVSGDGGATVLCSPAGLITESDCGPVRRKVLATGVPSRAVTIPASELQAYLNSLPRLLTEHHDITLSGTCSQDVRMQDFYGSGSLTLRADDLGDCVFTGSVSIENCGVPVTLENLKWALGAEADSNTYCIDCCGGHISAQDCSFNGYASTDGGTAGNGVNTYPNTSAVLGNCAFHDLQNTVHTYLGGRVEIYGDNPKTDYSGNSVGAYTYWNGLVMLGAGVPTTLGASTNYRNSGGAIIQDGKLI